MGRVSCRPLPYELLKNVGAWLTGKGRRDRVKLTLYSNVPVVLILWNFKKDSHGSQDRAEGPSGVE